jgi:hypothetical protein
MSNSKDTFVIQQPDPKVCLVPTPPELFEREIHEAASAIRDRPNLKSLLEGFRNVKRAWRERAAA